jgi:3-oxosteroid 1-dehydrogenase
MMVLQVARLHLPNAGRLSKFEASLVPLCTSYRCASDTSPKFGKAFAKAMAGGESALSIAMPDGKSWDLTIALCEPRVLLPRPPSASAGEVFRSVESTIFNARWLGNWYDRFRKQEKPYPPMFTDEACRLVRASTSLANMLFAFRVLGLRGFGRKVIGQIPTAMGPALVCQLLYLNLRHQSRIWTQTPLEELIVEDKAVVGAVVSHEGRNIRIRARRGVLLVAGGFARNAAMRAEHQEAPITSEWTSAQEGDQGDAILIGKSLNAKVELMDDAWWGPSFVHPVSGQRIFMIYERSLPHSIIVDSDARRFMNEALPYCDAGHEMYRRNRKVPAIPAWLILDHNHRRRYPLADMLPGTTPQAAIDCGFVVKADTLSELAEQIGVKSGNLNETTQRFNSRARQGQDEDFGRGRSAHDQFFGDDLVKPNGNLGAIDKPPFYAIKVWPGDLGTKGGLLTDESARVIGPSGTHIPGLYAAGNSTASVMGRTYPGPGSTPGPALTFAYLAVNNMAGKGRGSGA